MADKVPDASDISLKALVDKESNRVLFVEADNDFIDVLFSFMTIPMGHIVRLSRDHSTQLQIGCMNKLYESIEKLDVQDFRSNECKDMLLLPHSAADSYCRNLKLKLYEIEQRKHFICSCRYPYRLSYYVNVRCPDCREPMNREIPLCKNELEGVFVKGRAKLIITDDLHVIPSISATSVLFRKLGVTDMNKIEELKFNIGVKEVLNLLMCSLVSKTPFTETLLKHCPSPKDSGVNFERGTCIDSQILSNEEARGICVKLVVSKSKKMVYYAEVREDFVNLLCSFSTLPLGFILKQMQCEPWSGCIDRLQKGVSDFDEQFLKSTYHKELLKCPKVLPGFCYDNNFLGIEEHKFYTSIYTLSTLCTNASCINQAGGVRVLDPKSQFDQCDSARGYLKGPANFTVTDNLDVMPLSPLFQLSLLKKWNVPSSDIEDLTVHVGKEEALRLLVASFLSKSALTNAFLREPREQEIKLEH